MRPTKLQAMRANRDRAALQQLRERAAAAEGAFRAICDQWHETRQQHMAVGSAHPWHVQASLGQKAQRGHLLHGAAAFLLDQLRALWRYLSRKTQ